MDDNKKQLLIDAGVVDKDAQLFIFEDAWKRVVRFFQGEGHAIEGLKKWVEQEKQKKIEVKKK